MEIKFHVGIDVLKYTIVLGVIDEFDEYDNMIDSKLRAYLYEDSSESRATLKLSRLESIVRKNLKIIRKNKDARSRMKELLICYYTLLSGHGL